MLDTAHTGATGWEEAAGTAVTTPTVQKTVATEWEKADTVVTGPAVQETAATEWETADDTAVARPTVQETAAHVMEWKKVEDTALAGPANGVAVAELGHDVKDETGLSIALVGSDY